MKQLKTIGILGGMSSAATGEYYHLINRKVNEALGRNNIAEMIIVSVNFENIERVIQTGTWEEGGRYLAKKAQQLEKAGACCVILATNTLHKVRDQIKAAVNIPFIDIFETVTAELKKQGFSKVGLLGTYPVMTDSFFADAYAANGIKLLTPDEKEKKEIHRVIFEELTQHKFLAGSKEFLLQSISKLHEQGAQAVILGCTEFGLLVKQNDVPGVPLFDTTELHCALAARISAGLVEV